MRGRVAVVAGATRGAGRIAAALGEAGATVICTGSPAAKARDVQNGPAQVTQLFNEEVRAGMAWRPARLTEQLCDFGGSHVYISRWVVRALPVSVRVDARLVLAE